jgi:hypothetical protein
VLIYALFRNADWLAFTITGKPVWGKGGYGRFGPLMDILIYNVPDGLWLLSGLLFMRSLWPGGEPAGCVYRLLFCFIALLFEGLQWFDWTLGTLTFSI